MDEIAVLAKEIERGKVARARAASIEEKLLDGPRLFATACEAARAGIRVHYPDADESQVERILWQQMYGGKDYAR
jgi:hypothetical protein